MSSIIEKPLYTGLAATAQAVEDAINRLSHIESPDGRCCAAVAGHRSEFFKAQENLRYLLTSVSDTEKSVNGGR